MKRFVRLQRVGPLANWVLLACIGVLPPALYFFWHISDNTFLPSTMGNWFATVVGVALGVPIAVEITRRQQAEQERIEQTRMVDERHANEMKLLTVLREELVYNRLALEIVVEQQAARPNAHTIRGLNTTLWSALSNAGELHAIDDLQLLQRLAVTYHSVAELKLYEDAYRDPSFYMRQTLVPPGDNVIPRTTQLGMTIQQNANELRPDVLRLVQDALVALDLRITSLSAVSSHN